MPIYHYAHSGAPLSIVERDKIAKGILKIHHEITNAPEPFVRVVFQPVPLGFMYTAGEIAPTVLLSCQIRSGRTVEQKQQIMTRCYQLIREVTKLTPDEIVLAVAEHDGPMLMEAGLFLPDANDAAEADWVRRLQETYPGDYDDWGVDGRRPAEPTEETNERASQLRSLVHEVAEMVKRESPDPSKALEPLRKLLRRDTEIAEDTPATAAR